MSAPRSLLTGKVLMDIDNERMRQVDKWGIQHRPEVIPGVLDSERFHAERDAREACDSAEKNGPLPGYTGGATWEDIIREELAEAVNELDKAKRREELVQCAAVLVAWIEDLDAH